MPMAIVALKLDILVDTCINKSNAKQPIYFHTCMFWFKVLQAITCRSVAVINLSHNADCYRTESDSLNLKKIQTDCSMCDFRVSSMNTWNLLYIQLSFSVYLTCKWKGAVSYDTLPGTGFTGSGTIFSLVTTAGKFNRERLFWSLYEVSSNFTADMLFCFVSPSLCKFYNSGSTKQIWFSLPDSSLEHSNSWPTQHSCQESVSKMNF